MVEDSAAHIITAAAAAVAAAAATAAICNSGGNPNVTYASGSPTIPAPTVTCLYDASALPYLGQYSSVIAGRCVGVCRNAPPAATGVLVCAALDPLHLNL
jgi:hypothetical protein